MKHRLALLLLVSELSVPYAAAAADHWTKPFDLNSGSPNNLSVGVDAAGDAVGVWVDGSSCSADSPCPLVADSRPAGGLWGKATLVSSPGASAFAPSVFMNDAGQATAIWFDYSGVYSANDQISHRWSAPAQVFRFQGSGNIPQGYQLGTDHLGDAVVIGLAGIYGDLDTINRVSVRKAGGAWATMVSPASRSTNQNAGYAAAASTTGDVFVAWLSYCLSGQKCNNAETGFHVSRLPGGSTTWQDSGPLAASNLFGLVADDQGRTGALVSDKAGHLFLYTQAAAGQPFVASALAPTTAYPYGFGADTAGHVTVITLEGTQPNTTIKGYEITLGGRTWKSDGILSSSTRSPANPTFAVSPTGSAVLAWQYGPYQGLTDTIASVTRPSATAPWTAPTVVSAPNIVYGGVNSVAAAGAGQAVVGYKTENSAQTIYRIWAVDHRP